MMRTPERSAFGSCCSLFASGMGAGGVVAGAEGLLEVFLPSGSTRGEVEEKIRRLYPRATGESRLTLDAAAALERYLAGEPEPLDFAVDLRGVTAFSRKVYEVAAAIPRGSVRTYGSLAAVIGSPGAARGVGAALARNSLPLIIPCHRVVATGGALTGFTAPGGLHVKRLLLEMEGVEVDAAGRVLQRYVDEKPRGYSQ